MKPDIGSFDELKADYAGMLTLTVALDFNHDEAAAMASFWPLTKSEEFRLPLLRTACGFWENEVRSALGEGTSEYWFAIEGVVDSYDDPELGYSLFLELSAYCASDGIGETAWTVLDDDPHEKRFVELLLETTRRQLKVAGATIEPGIDIEITELSEE